jgi:hypothetical protein
MKRSATLVCLAISLCLTLGSCDKGKNRLDIALEGPWILYQDAHFESVKGGVSVLIAIAPTGAVAENLKMAKGDQDHHHIPQLSTGDGYYVPKPDVYCITFDEVCAREGPAVLTTDHYPSSSLLTIPFHGAADRSATLDWVKFAKAGNTVLILPMPDSYSNDGVFPMHFASTFYDGSGGGAIGYKPLGGEGHSIGIHLHYAHGPDHISLTRCDKAKVPTIANCSAALGAPYELENNGTLRLHMRAPDNDDGCDRHVRFAYHQVFQIIGNDSNRDYAYIEPAIWDGKKFKYEGPGDDKCFKKDPQRGGGSSPSEGMNFAPSEAAIPAAGQEVLILPLPILDVVKILDQLNLKDDKEGNLALAKQAAQDAQTASSGLDPDFPRISQVQRIGQLLSTSAEAIETFQNNVHLEKKDREQLEHVTANEEKIVDATKNGNDCRAPVVLLQ